MPPPNDFDLLVNLIITSFGCVALVFSFHFFFKYILRVFSFVAILRDTFLLKTQHTDKKKHGKISVTHVDKFKFMYS